MSEERGLTQPLFKRNQASNRNHTVEQTGARLAMIHYKMWGLCVGCKPNWVILFFLTPYPSLICLLEKISGVNRIKQQCNFHGIPKASSQRLFHLQAVFKSCLFAILGKKEKKKVIDTWGL